MYNNNAVRNSGNSECLTYADELIRENLQKLRLQKLISQQKK